MSGRLRSVLFRSGESSVGARRGVIWIALWLNWVLLVARKAGYGKYKEGQAISPFVRRPLVWCHQNRIYKACVCQTVHYPSCTPRSSLPRTCSPLHITLIAPPTTLLPLTHPLHTSSSWPTRMTSRRRHKTRLYVYTLKYWVKPPGLTFALTELVQRRPITYFRQRLFKVEPISCPSPCSRRPQSTTISL